MKPSAGQYAACAARDLTPKWIGRHVSMALAGGTRLVGTLSDYDIAPSGSVAMWVAGARYLSDGSTVIEWGSPTSIG